jgi:hypothetical protein
LEEFETKTEETLNENKYSTVDNLQKSSKDSLYASKRANLEDVKIML